MKKIVVVGSINMDLVTICERAPRGGETLLGKKFMQIPGGKGANQAVAIGKMNSSVAMLGKIGKE
ncbi:MAG: PfkB family carbohydrate kinase, partial [Cetobacterium sp.]